MEAKPGTMRQKRLPQNIPYLYMAPQRPQPPKKIVRKLTVHEEFNARLPGFEKMFKKTSIFNRTFWLLVSLSAYSFCCYQLREQIKAFIDDPTKSSKSYFYNRTVMFPTITVCRDFDVHTPDELSYLLGRNSQDLDNLLRAGNMTVFHIWDALGQYLENTQVLHMKELENFELFIKEKVYTILGSCYSMTAKQNLEFKVAQLDILVSTNTRKGMFQSKVMLHKKDEFILDKYLSSLSNVVFNPRKDEINAYSVDITQFVRRNTRKMPCSDDEYVLKCHLNQLKERIDNESRVLCRLPFMQEFETLPWCESLESITSTLLVVHNVTQSFQPSACPLKCNENYYNIKYADEKYAISRLSTKPGLMIQMYSNRIAIIHQSSAYNWLYFLCDIGGTLGFALGISGLQILEILTDCVSALYLVGSKFRRRRQIIPNFGSDHTVSEFAATIENIPGIRNITRHNVPLLGRVLWLSIFVVAVHICIYLSSMFAFQYFSESTERSSKYGYKERLTIPSFTVCPEHDHDYFPVLETSYSHELLGGKLSLPDVIKVLDNATLSIKDVWNMSRFSKNAVVFFMRTLNLIELGFAAQYVDTLTISGTCFTVVPGTTVTNIPVSFGVEFERKFNSSNIKPSQLRVFLHDIEERQLLTYFPRLGGYEYPVNMTPILQIHVEDVTYYNTPCQSSLDVGQCEVNCIESKIYHKSSVQCRLPYMQYTSSIRECANGQDYLHVMKATIAIMKTVHLDECNCPNRCKHTLYSIVHYYFPKVLNVNVATFTFVDKILEETEESESYSLSTLFSDIGGALALTLGICALTMIELVFKSLSKLTLNVKAHIHPKPKMQKSHAHKVIILHKRETGKAKQNRSNGRPTKSNTFEVGMEKDSKLWVRSVWFAINLFAFCACINQCSERIRYFWSDPSAIDTYYMVNQTITFPMVVICPVKKGFSLTLNNFIVFAFRRPDNLQRTLSVRINFSRTEFFINGIKTKDIILSEVLTFRGWCVTLRSKNPIPYKGKDTSLHGKLYYLNPNLRTVRSVLITTVHSADEIPQLPYDRDVNLQHKILFFKGTTLEIHAVESINRNTGQVPCEVGDKSSKCLLETFEKRIYSKIKKACRLPYMQESRSIPSCISTEEERLVFNATVQIVANTNLYDYRSFSCPRKCRSIWYSYENEKKFRIRPSKNFSWIDFSVKFPSNRIYVMQEKAAYTSFSLFSDLGGAIGLYFGFGLLQICEIMVKLFSKLLTLLAMKNRIKNKLKDKICFAR